MLLLVLLVLSLVLSPGASMFRQISESAVKVDTVIMAGMICVWGGGGWFGLVLVGVTGGLGRVL